MASNELRRRGLCLYKSLLRESQKFSSYNFRMYAQRKIRDEFRAKKTITVPAIMEEELTFAQTSLDMIRRQVIVGNLYSADKLVIEKSV